MKKSVMPQKSALQHAVKLALLGLATAATPSFAQLLDHGPSDPTLIWPQWYRDNDGTAVGMCKSTAASPNAAGAGGGMCFPLPPTAGAFAGNIGPEVFYNLLEYKQKPGAAAGFNFRYLAALEASYLPGPNPVHGQETVFARIRIAINFNDPSFAGDYTITHPYGVEHFTDVQPTATNTVQGGQAAVFSTFDVPLGAPMDFNGALGGPLGPFIQWDVLNPGETLTVGGEEFLGDPNYPHTFTGSPFGTNFIRIDGPVGANLDGAGNNFLIINEANVLGQKWTAPIASNLSVEKALKTRTPNLNAVDVWAKSSANHKLILTGAGIPSMQMHEDPNLRGHYHGHMEYTGANMPTSITVTDETSLPIVASNAQLTDNVEISLAQYDTNTGDIDVKATSSDKLGNPTLLLEGLFGVPSPIGASPAVTGILTPEECNLAQFQSAGVAPDEVCFHHTLPLTNEPPKFISVRSSEGGSHDDGLVMLEGNPQNITPAPVAENVSLSASASGTTTLALPANAWIVSQPSSGTLVRQANGTYAFTPNPGTVAGADAFGFVVQNPSTGAVSNAAIAHLTITFSPTAPIANPDQFAAGPLRTAKVLNVLANDKPNTPDAANAIDPRTVTITQAPTRGTATVNATTGAITYTPTTAAVTDTIRYTVRSVSGLTSAPATLQVTNFSAAEAISFKKAPSYVNGKWTINPGTSWFGANLGQTLMSCYYLPTLTSPVTPANLIGSALVDVTGVTPAAIVGTAPAAATGSSVRCFTSNGGTGTAAVVFK